MGDSIRGAAVVGWPGTDWRGCGGLPVPRQQLVQATERLVGDPLEPVGEPSLRIDVVELGRTDQPVHDRGPLAATIRAAEQPCLTAEGHPSQAALSGVAARTDPPIVEQAREGRPALEHAVHGPGDGRVPREPRAFAPHPGREGRHEQRRMLAATGKPQLGGPAVDLPRVGEDGIDPSYRLERQGAGGALPGRARSASSKKCRLAWDQHRASVTAPPSRVAA